MLQYSKLISSSGIDSGSESLISTILTVGVPDKSRYSHWSQLNSKYSLFIVLIGISYPSFMDWDNFCCESIHVIRSIVYFSDGSDTLCSCAKQYIL